MQLVDNMPRISGGVSRNIALQKALLDGRAIAAERSWETSDGYKIHQVYEPSRDDYVYRAAYQGVWLSVYALSAGQALSEARCLVELEGIVPDTK